MRGARANGDDHDSGHRLRRDPVAFGGRLAGRRARDRFLLLPSLPARHSRRTDARSSHRRAGAGQPGVRSGRECLGDQSGHDRAPSGLPRARRRLGSARFPRARREAGSHPRKRAPRRRGGLDEHRALVRWRASAAHASREHAGGGAVDRNPVRRDGRRTRTQVRRDDDRRDIGSDARPRRRRAVRDAQRRERVARRDGAL